ncbi:MAG: nucleotidyltransferase domain-containing protein [Alphaproteobacteria bacterium]|nr:nucleotidyltransferase domain-containing protein [Alphaproteobacteria bacterium]
MKPTKLQQVLLEIEAFRVKQKSTGFCLIYGSQATSTNTEASDIDIMFINKRKPPSIKAYANFITKLHNNFGCKIDNEVPYDNKIVISYEEAKKAANLTSFIFAGKELIIPPIKKESIFLGSKHIKYRLVFNALTGPHIFVGGDVDDYKKIMNTAVHSLAILAMAINGKNTFVVPDLIDALKRGESGAEGEDYLGYKDSQLVNNAMWSNLNMGLNQLCKTHKIELVSPGKYAITKNSTPEKLAVGMWRHRNMLSSFLQYC